MHTTIGRYRGREVLICAPNWRQYGHLALEILQAYAAARETARAVYIVRRRGAANAALFDIEPDGEIDLVRPHAFARSRLTLRLARQTAADELRALTDRFGQDVRKEVRDELTLWRDRPGVPTPVVERVRTAKDWLRTPFWFERPRLRPEDRPQYFRRRLLRTPVPVRLGARAHEEAARQAAAIGLDETTPIVTIHAREPGYKRGRETRDTKPDHARDDSTRNVRIESYFAAIDHLIGRGFTVVRIGDPTMTPVARRGVIDLATMPARTPLLEIYCLFRSRFLIASDSGPSAAAYLTNTPLVSLNCTDPIAAYPLRPAAIYTLKRVADRRTGRRLTPREMIESDFITNNRNPRRYRYYDNTPQEVLAAVHEMLDMLDGRLEMSAAQQEYKARLLAVEAALQPVSHYVHKWGADDGFLGDGRIARCFIDRDC